jgi:20S proteasome subunit alpha 6
MRKEALNNKYVYGTPIQGSRLVSDVADMHQRCTQSYVRRPYGIGLLIASFDQTGPHLYVTEPSGNFFEYYAMAIGTIYTCLSSFLSFLLSFFLLCLSVS